MKLIPGSYNYKCANCYSSFLYVVALNKSFLYKKPSFKASMNSKV